MKKRNIDWKWRTLVCIPILVIGYFIYDTFYPSAEFYKEDFKEVTGIVFPENAEFEYKTAGYPDTHGDYTSVSILHIGKEYYKNIDQELIDNGLSENDARIGSKEMDEAKVSLNGLKIEREFSREHGDKFYYVALLSDKETVLVQRSSH